jgi:hypothetical protein
MRVTTGVQEGVLALYRGWLPSVIGVIPYVGLNFAVYETLKDMAVKHYGCHTERDLSSGLRLAAGGVAGTIGQTIAYPFDVVRRRLQARHAFYDFTNQSTCKVSNYLDICSVLWLSSLRRH